jgi:phospholipid/cholesterol/gamma-HCH transport system permease protein
MLYATPAPTSLPRAALRVLAGWWGVLHFGAVALVLALSPSSHTRAQRSTTALLLYRTTWQVLPWFTALCALISLVMVRIVLVTAQSYGLSQFALEMVVRVLVLELIPLSAALFVVLRSGLATGAEIASMRQRGDLDSWQHGDIAPWRAHLVPRVVASAFSVVTLAAVSCVVALVLAYVAVYGFTPWGFAPYTRMVGRVFEPSVALSFGVKLMLFSLAVAVIPMASALQQPRAPQPVRLDDGTVPVPFGTVRLLVVLALIEATSLAIRYF